jgi:hypothetical protein
VNVGLVVQLKKARLRRHATSARLRSRTLCARFAHALRALCARKR